jgi:hypothetical protein
MAKQSPGNHLRRLPFLYAAGAVFWLVVLTQFLAVLAAPAGRQQIEQAFANAGFGGNADALLAVEATLLVFFEVVAAALHAAAYYGLRRYQAWGWAAAVVVAGAWTLILIGLPVFVLLLRRQTREAYGVP